MNKYQRDVIKEAVLACREAHHTLDSIDHNIGHLGMADLEYSVLCSVKDLLESLTTEYYIKSQQDIEGE